MVSVTSSTARSRPIERNADATFVYAEHDAGVREAAIRKYTSASSKSS